MKPIIIYFSILLLAASCINVPAPDADRAKSDILIAEKEFAAMAADSGIADAFLYFAADDAVMLRGNEIIYGKEMIRKYFENQQAAEITLSWAPDFVDVSASGDLGYTYGKYSFSATDSTGITTSAEGYFHTVWKRQADGTWKFVWD